MSGARRSYTLQAAATVPQAETREKREEQLHGQAHHVEVLSIDPLDQRRAEPLYAVRTRFVERFTGGNVFLAFKGIKLTEPYPGHGHAGLRTTVEGKAQTREYLVSVSGKPLKRPDGFPGARRLPQDLISQRNERVGGEDQITGRCGNGRGFGNSQPLRLPFRLLPIPQGFRHLGRPELERQSKKLQDLLASR